MGTPTRAFPVDMLDPQSGLDGSRLFCLLRFAGGPPVKGVMETHLLSESCPSPTGPGTGELYDNPFLNLSGYLDPYPHPLKQAS